MKTIKLLTLFVLMSTPLFAQEFTEQIEAVSTLLDYKLIALIIISSYWVKANFQHLFKNISIAHKIFIWSTIVSIGYYFLLSSFGAMDNGNYFQLIISYFAATSFYEIAFEPLEKLVNKLIKK